VYVTHSNCVRGYLKGLWAPCHFQPCGHGDTFSGSGSMSGKSFIALNVLSTQSVSGNAPNGTGNGQLVIETSNTWS
jgi:hypothetical protein